MAPVRRGVLCAAVAAWVLAGCASAPSAQVPQLFEATLDGAQEVPVVATTGRGQARVEVDTHHVMRWSLNFEGLSGPVTGAHIHGPAGPGQNAPVLVPFQASPGASTLSGQAHITPEQLTQLDSGQWYVNVHTANHPGGEIRGQLRPRR